MYNFIEYIAAIESKEFTSVEQDKIQWARDFVKSIIENLENETHAGDCINENYPCNLCTLEGLLTEYRRYNLNNKPSK